MKIIVSIVLGSLFLGYLFYGISPLAIFVVMPVAWLILGVPAFCITYIKKIVPAKLRTLFVSSFALYIAQIVIFVLSFRIEGIYNISGHGYSDPSSIYWLNAILVTGNISLLVFISTLYVSNWKTFTKQSTGLG